MNKRSRNATRCTACLRPLTQSIRRLKTGIYPMPCKGVRYRIIIACALIAAGLNDIRRVDANQARAAQIAIFDQYCTHRFTAIECEGALRHILLDQPAEYLTRLGYDDDLGLFEDELRDAVEFGRVSSRDRRQRRRR